MKGTRYSIQKSERASRDELESIQFQKLETMLKKVYASNSFYQNKFKHHGVSLSEIRSMDDLRKLPFTVKKELEEDQERNPPFGTNLSESIRNYTQ